MSESVCRPLDWNRRLWRGSAWLLFKLLMAPIGEKAEVLVLNKIFVVYKMIAPRTIRLSFLWGSCGGQNDANISIDYLINFYSCVYLGS